MNESPIIVMWNNIVQQIGLFFAWFRENSTSLIHCAIGAVASFVLFFIVLFFLRRCLCRLLQKKHPNIANGVMALALPLSQLLLLACLALNLRVKNCPLFFSIFWLKLFQTLFLITFIGIFMRSVGYGINLLEKKLEQKYPENFSMNKLLLDLTRSIIRLVVWICGTIVFLQKVLELDVSHLLVSAGVMGLGIAFAAQNTIANIFGAFAILGSKLIHVGDWIKTNGAEGVVERIGIRSVTIRTFSGRLIDIPNRLISDATLENYSNCTHWREHFSYGLVYSTTPEQFALAHKILEEIGNDLADLMVPDKKPKFDLIECNAYSLDLDGYVWFKKTDWFTMRESRGKFNEEVIKRFTEAGLSFAFPTNSVYLENNTPTAKQPPVANAAKEEK